MTGKIIYLFNGHRMAVGIDTFTNAGVVVNERAETVLTGDLQTMRQVVDALTRFESEHANHAPPRSNVSVLPREALQAVPLVG